MGVCPQGRQEILTPSGERPGCSRDLVEVLRAADAGRSRAPVLPSRNLYPLNGERSGKSVCPCLSHVRQSRKYFSARPISQAIASPISDSRAPPAISLSIANRAPAVRIQAPMPYCAPIISAAILRPVERRARHARIEGGPGLLGNSPTAQDTEPSCVLESSRKSCSSSCACFMARARIFSGSLTCW